MTADLRDGPTGAEPDVPPPLRAHHLFLAAAPAQSDHGLPLANGLLGAAMWQMGDDLIVSLDRTDLWDLRPVPEFSGEEYSYANTIALHRAGKHEELIRRLEAPYSHPGPTKLPAGRIRIATGGWARGALDLASATGSVDLPDGGVVTAFVSHDDDCGRLAWIGTSDLALRLEAPAFGGKPQGWAPPPGPSMNPAEVWDLGYGPPTWSRGPNHQAFAQVCAEGFSFAVALAWGRDRAVWTIATSEEAADPLALALRRARAGLARGWAGAFAYHRRYWDALWARSRVNLPDPRIELQYNLDLYKLLAAGRRGAPPIALQGPWTVDDGRLPPWKGDYHHDLNTQMTYWPAYKGNHLEIGLGFLDWLWDTRPACRDWTRRYFGLPGLNAPMTADLQNRQIGGWRQYTHMASTSAWLAHHSDLHWRFSGDDGFLRDRAYPYLSEVCVFIEAVTAGRDPDGWRTLALSASPEINDNRPEAWFDTLTNYETSLFTWALARCAAMAETLGVPVEAARWRSVAAQFRPLAHDGTGLLIARGAQLERSHRHFSHLLAIHPLDLISWPQDADLISRSLAHLESTGPHSWMGYSFAWAASLHARVGNGEGTLRHLRAYADHCYPNSFHANGDWQGKGHTRAVFGAFTLEGNCAAAAAVQDMLLDSRPGRLALFPAMPPAWREASFHGLLADGGVEVSATLTEGAVTALSLRASAPRQVLVSGPGLQPRRVDLAPRSTWRLG